MLSHLQVVSYLSDIGGILGLWIGFSLFTIFEFLELFSDVLVLGLARKIQAKRISNEDPNSSSYIEGESSACTSSQVSAVTLQVPDIYVDTLESGVSSQTPDDPPTTKMHLGGRTPPPPYSSLSGIQRRQSYGVGGITSGRRKSRNSYYVPRSPRTTRKHQHMPLDILLKLS